MVHGKNRNLPSVTLSRRKKEIQASLPAVGSHCNIDGEGSKHSLTMERALDLWRRRFRGRQCAAPFGIELR